MYIGARPLLYGVFLMFLVLVLTLANGLCCSWFIYPFLCWCWCQRWNIKIMKIRLRGFTFLAVVDHLSTVLH
jgi:hypothetical protein